MRGPSVSRNLGSVLANVVLALCGGALALGLIEVLLRTFPKLAPREVRVNPPVRRVEAFVNAYYDVRLSDGDLFHWMRGIIIPLSPDEDSVLAHVHMVTDGNGFRNAPPELATYGIVALGDSFTRGSGVPIPWPRLLSETTGIDALNLGEVGIGPQQELQLLRQFGLEKRPRWVIMAFFEGNDLYDAGSYVQANPFIVARLGRYVLTTGIAAWEARGTTESEASRPPTFQYPITTKINGVDLKTAFFPGYLAWLSVNGETIGLSRNFQLTTETILKMRTLSDNVGARFLLVYVPSKEHVYLPLLEDDAIRARVFKNVPALALDEAGLLQFSGQSATAELIWQHIDDQGRLLEGFAGEQGVQFLNLTARFSEAAALGAELYYPFDTHWNQNGHDLAAQVIGEYLLALPSN